MNCYVYLAHGAVATREETGLIRRLKTNYTNLKIKNKLFLIHLCIVFAVCAASLAAIQVALHIYQEILQAESAKVLNLSTISIENEIKGIDRISLNIVSNAEIQSYLRNVKRANSRHDSQQDSNNLRDSLWTYRFERNIFSVNLIDAAGNQYSGGGQIAPQHVGPIVAKAARRNGSMVLINPLPGDASLICARQVREIRGLSLEPLGTLIIRVNMDSLVRRYIGNATNYSDTLLILSGARTIYAMNGLATTVAKTPSLQRAVGYRAAGYRLNSLRGKNYFITYTGSDVTGWTYINIIPYEIVFKQIYLIRNIVLFISLGVFCLTVFISVRFAHSLTKPLEELTQKMKRVEYGEFEAGPGPAASASRNDEIGQLQRDFDIMLQKINTLIQDNYLKQIALKDAQFKALQVQINPHFLYNTLESINWLAKVNQQPKISLMVESLGNLLRSAVSNQKHVITLREEVQLLQSYIAIQQARFEERLQFTIEIEEDLDPYCIPKLTLQPVVENSINYGLENMAGVCHIALNAASDAGDIVIVIADNGPGIAADLMAQLKKGTVKAKGSGIGLLNIDERIKLLFGQEYGVSLANGMGRGVPESATAEHCAPECCTADSGTTDCGTQVTIRIPKRKAGDINV